MDRDAANRTRSVFFWTSKDYERVAACNIYQNSPLYRLRIDRGALVDRTSRTPVTEGQDHSIYTYTLITLYTVKPILTTNFIRRSACTMIVLQRNHKNHNS